MITRNKEYYDLVAHGLLSQGYSGPRALETWINDTFASKYNAESTFAQMGFPLNPNIPINPTFEQIEATIRPYTMATYVDIDSDGATKSTDGLALKMGSLPTFKHEVTMSRKTLREKMLLADAIGGTTPEIELFQKEIERRKREGIRDPVHNIYDEGVFMNWFDIFIPPTVENRKKRA